MTAGYLDTRAVGSVGICLECGARFVIGLDRHLYCSSCMPAGYVLSAPLQRAEEYPDDDPDLSLELEPLDDTDELR